MTRRCATEIEFPEVLRLVAAHARSPLGARRILETDALPSPGEGVLSCRLTLEAERLLAEEGPLHLGGIDDALPLLDPASPPPAEVPGLMALLSLARRVASVRRTLAGLGTEFERLDELGRRLPDTAGLVQWVSQRLGRDGTVPDTASPQLASVRRGLVRTRRELLQRLEAFRRRHAAAATDAPPTVRRDRYCLPVRAAARNEVPGLVLDASGSGATVFVEPFEIVDANNALVELAAREREEVRRIVDEVAAAMTAAIPELRRAADVLAELDAAQARALFGRAAGGIVVPPGGEALVLESARHPLLDERLAPLRREVLGEDPELDRRVVPLDLELPPDVRTLVISGPNAGGKTVVLKTVGLMVLMAYHGIPLPAGEGTHIPAIDRLWCHVGDEQDVARDLSTFSAAMAATSELLASPPGRTLVLYDELGAGTDPLEGAALGTALLEELTRRGGITIATTHLAAISQAVAGAEGMENAAMGYDEATGRPTYRLVVGRPGRSRGLEIARRMGVPAAVVDRADALLGGQHLEMERWLRRMERLEQELEAARRTLELDSIELARRRREAEEERRRLEEERRRLGERLEAERTALRRKAKERLDRAMARLDEAMERQERLGRRRRERIRQEALALDASGGGPAPEAPAALEPGVPVRLRSLGTRGTVEAVRGGRVRVAAGGKRIWVAADDVEPEPVPAGTASAPARAVRVAVEAPAEREIKLLGMDAETAREELERFLDRAFAAGVPRVRVVHGHGTGTLRRVVGELCRTHPAVHAFAHPPQHRGGSGVTEIELEEPGDG